METLLELIWEINTNWGWFKLYGIVGLFALVMVINGMMWLNDKFWGR